MNKSISANRPKRLLSLDIMRGITIAGMILVNNPGSWNSVYAPLRHASWDGLTPTDLVFPFFMFIMGISTYISLRKYDFTPSWPTFRKILRRTVTIFAIGLAIAWLGLFLKGIHSGKAVLDAAMNFDQIRILGVLPRLALCYGIASVLAVTLRHRWLPVLVVGMLVTYTVLLLCGYGYEFSERNIIAVVDRCVLGEAHMYTDWIDGVPVKLDPEGLLSTLPSVAHVLIGFWCGMLVMGTKDNDKRVQSLFIVGTILTFAGFLLSYGLPINKKIWSPTFVMTTCGLAASLLGLLMWIIDIRGHKRWCRFFEAFGVNPLFLYVLAAVMSIILSRVPVAYGDGSTSLHGWIYLAVMLPLSGGDKMLASLLFALAFVGFNWIIGYFLYKKRIYIKI